MAVNHPNARVFLGTDHTIAISHPHSIRLASFRFCFYRDRGKMKNFHPHGGKNFRGQESVRRSQESGVRSWSSELELENGIRSQELGNDVARAPSPCARPRRPCHTISRNSANREMGLPQNGDRTNTKFLLPTSPLPRSKCHWSGSSFLAFATYQKSWRRTFPSLRRGGEPRFLALREDPRAAPAPCSPPLRAAQSRQAIPRMLPKGLPAERSSLPPAAPLGSCP